MVAEYQQQRVTKNNHQQFQWVFVLLSVVYLTCGLAHPAVAGEFDLKPTIAISEEYTDNVFDSPQKGTDYITRAMPGLALIYKAPLWDWNLAYNLDYRYFARQSRSETTHILNARGVVTLIDEVFFLELSDTYRRASLDLARDTTSEGLTTNQSDQNVGTVSPYLVLHPTSALTVRTGYRYINTWYREPGANDTRSHAAFLDSSYEITPKLFSTLGYTFTREESSAYGLYRHEMSAGPRYEYAEKSFIFAQGGATVIEYDDRSETVNPTWSAGITHTFLTMTVNLMTGVTYTNDPLGNSVETRSYGVSLQKPVDRGSLLATSSYTEFIDTKLDMTKIRRLSAGISGTYELLQDLKGSLGLSYDRFNDLVQNGFSNKFFVDSSLSYDFGKDLFVTLSYKYIDYSSPTIATDNWQSNRVILEVRKTF